jgi:hypothetical protein
VKGVVVVAPEGARWALRAARMLTAAGLHVARLPDERALGLMVAMGTVGVVLLDSRSATPAWPARQARLQTMTPRTRFLIIHEDEGDAVVNAVAWPDDTDAAWQLVTAR